MENVVIRPILQKDNEAVAEVIRQVLVDLGVPKVGTAYADKALDCMYENYNVPKATYFVAEVNGKILGCAGVAQLENYKGNVCELQKMYFLEEARGKGLGSKMMNACIAKAKYYRFNKCYLETMPYMKDAQKLYKKTGFEYINERMGDTGHYSCPVFMLLNL
ncbi:GNAT family N-acetyltransferase [Cellulophaga lytica]|uniref:GCN5-related N-acetyltransferase n=1 Tax=Cellulophaga lytica (strain ATCC 23178 / DSM 7489 / JCM 8516 / NBRC 14961 / NCIMB 1423 / VKM B-1433 / Cy l20) TaxID=867900 RepID=F0RF98_CELLC|nr:GNAT family N-acetyltransferase [Cellulophaga lytica]ADY31114.1 GCN5-related N-acetyltransferase [Cellulophaga lytica DSM 7489]AIM62076.1 acetyltransferase [Cellulophaga lytica]APU11952.1 acetyltransferase [Cellulophaga lytica]MDO6852981.1 GNAT family N-acetyltransferase [Cellulophaga lytica]WQG77976.1 GNAT family N-acetyltransferase [Cellulophaga lytica]